LVRGRIGGRRGYEGEHGPFTGRKKSVVSLWVLSVVSIYIGGGRFLRMKATQGEGNTKYEIKYPREVGGL